MTLIREGGGKRDMKRRRLESVIFEIETTKKQDNELGLAFKCVSKASLIKKAKLGKNYIDKLGANDPLFIRIQQITKSSKSVIEKRDVEKYRLNRIQELEATIQTLREMISEITDENTRFRIELNNVKEDLAGYESRYELEHRLKPDLRMVKNDESATHPKENYDD